MIFTATRSSGEFPSSSISFIGLFLKVLSVFTATRLMMSWGKSLTPLL